MESIKFLARPRVGMGAGRSAARLRRRGTQGVVGLMVFAGLLILGSIPALAQNTGSIFGTVQDATGAVVPGATVTATDASTSTTRTVTSNGSGDFQVSSLPVGEYSLTVTSPQFEAYTVTHIVLDANANVKELIKLHAGPTRETVTVTDDSGSTIDAKSAQLGTLIDAKLIEDLPIDGHNVVALSALLPGVVDVNAPTTFTGDTKGPTYSASGSRNTQNLMLFDGLMWNNLFYNTGINYPPPNALQEVSVVLNNYKAQYGRNAGSVFNVLTKRGTNQIHGAVWDYIQNQFFNAADYISQINPKDNIDQLGFTIGAPIIKDKLFVFGAFQDLIGRLQNTSSVAPIGLAERGLLFDGKTPRPCSNPGPFVGMYCANFAADATYTTNPLSISGTSSSGAQPSDAVNMLTSAYQQAGGTAATPPCVAELSQAASYTGPVAFPTTANQKPGFLPNSEVPVNCLNPVMTNIINQFIPANANSALGLALGLSTTVVPAPTGDRNLLVRTDYILNGQNTFDVRYNLISSNAVVSPGITSASVGVANYGIVNSFGKSNFGNVGWTWVMTPNLLNVMRFGYKRYESGENPTDHRTLNSFGGNLVVPGTPTLPSFNFSNEFELGSPTTQGYQDHINENVELNESMTWTKGNHTIQGGFQFLRLQYLQRMDYPGLISYSSTFTKLSFFDGVLGLANSTQEENRLIQGGIQHDVFTYLQDDWRATPKLTLNLGIRYELPFQWFEPHGEAATFVPGQQSTVFPNAIGGLAFPGDKGVLPSLVPTDPNGIVPRLGFAYDVTGEGKFLIRGGFGIFSDAINANVVGVGEPYHFIFYHLLPPGGASVPLAGYGPNGSVLTIPGAFNPANPQFIGPYSVFFPDKNFRTPYVEAANFGFQYHIPHAGVLDTNYVGKFARKLTVPLDLNPAIYDCSGGYYQSNPSLYCANANSSPSSTAARVRYAPFNYGGQGIVDILSVGTSNYNGLQVQYVQRGGRHLMILSSYTYSRSLDIQTNGQTTSNAVPDVFNLSSDYGLSDNNATHIFNLGWVLHFPAVTAGNSVLRAVLNNWIYSGQYLAHTGRPYSVTINNDSALDGESNQRAALVPGVNPKLSSSRHRAAKISTANCATTSNCGYFNRDAFTYPKVGTFSPVGRNAFIGPGYIMTNMTMGRDFPLAHIREGMRLNVRGEAFNVFNTPNLANPNSQYSCTTTSTFSSSNPFVPESCTAAGGSYTTTFANVQSTYGNNANTSTNGRKIQFSMTIFY